MPSFANLGALCGESGFRVAQSYLFIVLTFIKR